MTIPSWLAIAGITFVVSLIGALLSPQEIRWFKQLNRPEWLTFEPLIPFIWMFILICGAWSAYVVWETEPGSGRTWFFMGFYLLVEIAIVSYTFIMCKLRSLRVGTLIGATGFILGFILTLVIFPVSAWASLLLLPYLLWSPIGTYVTWRMMYLNPSEI